MMRGEILLICVTGSKVKFNFGTFSLKPYGHDTDYSFCPITIKLQMKVVDDEKRDPIDFGSGVKGQGLLWDCVYKTLWHDTDYSFCARSLLNFTYKLFMMRRATLLIFGHGVKFQGQIWPPCDGMPGFALSSFYIYMKRKRTRSDSVLWQKPLQKCQKEKVTTQTTPQKSSIQQRDPGSILGLVATIFRDWLPHALSRYLSERLLQRRKSSKQPTNQPAKYMHIVL